MHDGHFCVFVSGRQGRCLSAIVLDMSWIPFLVGGEGRHRGTHPGSYLDRSSVLTFNRSSLFGNELFTSKERVDLVATTVNLSQRESERVSFCRQDAMALPVFVVLRRNASATGATPSNREF